jgi:hypothetical protein
MRSQYQSNNIITINKKSPFFIETGLFNKQNIAIDYFFATACNSLSSISSISGIVTKR